MYLSASLAVGCTAAGFGPASEHLVIDPDTSKSNLQILVQGETSRQGSGLWPSAGKSGSPSLFRAGQAIPITVRAVDDYWNLVEVPDNGQPSIYVQSDDTHVSNPLVNGASTVGGLLTTSIQLRTRNLSPGWVLIASGSASGIQFGNNTSAYVRLDAGDFVLLFLHERMS